MKGAKAVKTSITTVTDDGLQPAAINTADGTTGRAVKLLKNNYQFFISLKYIN